MAFSAAIATSLFSWVGCPWFTMMRGHPSTTAWSIHSFVRSTDCCRSAASAAEMFCGPNSRLMFVTCDFAFANRSLVQKAFEVRSLNPHVVLTAQDSDVIKTYVELGLGVGILAKMAFDAKRDTMLRAIDASHLFESSTTRLGIKRGAYLRRYAYDFIELFAPHLARNTVERAVRGEEGSRYEL